jgi:hypothetical protein
VWFERALAKDPEGRFQSARAQARAFRAALGPRALPARALRPIWYSRTIIVGMAGAVALAALALVAWYGAGAPQAARAFSSVTRPWLLQPSTPATEPPSAIAPASAATQAAPTPHASASRPAQSAAPGVVSAQPPAPSKSSAPPSRRKEINPSEVL